VCAQTPKQKTERTAFTFLTVQRLNRRSTEDFFFSATYALCSDTSGWCADCVSDDTEGNSTTSTVFLHCCKIEERITTKNTEHLTAKHK